MARTNHSRLWPWILLGLVGCLWLMGCRKAAPTSVSFMIFGDPAEKAAYDQLVIAFKAKHADIDVQEIYIPSDGDYRTRLATDFAAGSPPDIALMNYRRIAAFAAKDQLEPLGPYLADSDIVQPDDFYPIALEAFTWQGEVVCIPQNVSSLVVYYNEKLFDAAGLPYPADDWTWDDFLTTAQALTQDSNGDGQMDQFGLGIAASLYRLAPFIWQNNGELVDMLEAPRQLALTRFPSLTALEWFTSLQTVHHLAPSRVEETAQDSESRFVAGTLAMFFNSRRVVPAFREITAFTWDVAPLPRGEFAASILHSDGYCLSAAAKNKDAAWAFIEFANSAEGQTIIAGTGRTVPSLKAVAESSAFLNPGQAPSRSAVWLDAIPNLHHVPILAQWAEIESVADEEIERAFYGEITPLEAAQNAKWRTEEYFLLSQQPTPAPTP